MVTTESVRVDNLCIDTIQSRDESWIGDDQDRQLAASIAQTGLLQDLLVRPVEQLDVNRSDRSRDADYAIIAGSRRYCAAMEAGRERVRCKILNADDLTAAWQSLSENTDRKPLSEQEVVQQLRLIYEMVRPRSEVAACPECGTAVDGEAHLTRHCQQTDCPLPSESLAIGNTGTGSTRLSPAGKNSGVQTQSDGRFLTDRQAIAYLAERYLGRSDDSARSIIEGHLRTAELPPVLQALFKQPNERTTAEMTALDNYNIGTSQPT